MLTVKSPPMVLVDRHRQMTHMFTRLLMDVFERRRDVKEPGFARRTWAMRWDFRLEPESGEEYGKIASLLLWSPSNYVHVLYREGERHSRNELGDGWVHLACHDSCWRNDGVEKFFHMYEEKLSSFDWIDPYCIVNLTEPEMKLLSNVRDVAQGR